MIDRVKLELTVDTIASLLVHSDFREAERLTKGARLRSTEVESAITSYGRRPVLPPSGHFEPRDVVEMEIDGSEPQRWSVYLDLWTAMEGRSDLTLELTLTDSTGDIYEIEVGDIRVL